MVEGEESRGDGGDGLTRASLARLVAAHDAVRSWAGSGREIGHLWDAELELDEALKAARRVLEEGDD